MAEKFCSNCSNPITEDSKFCPNCGAVVTNEVHTEPQPVEVQSEVQPEVKPEVQPQMQQQAPPPVQPQQAPQQAPQYYRPPMSSDPLSPLQWILTLIVLGLPLIGIIMTFVWAFSSTTNLNRKNYCIGVLIFAAIILVLTIVSAILFGGYFALLFNSFDRYY